MCSLDVITKVFHVTRKLGNNRLTVISYVCTLLMIIIIKTYLRKYLLFLSCQAR